MCQCGNCAPETEYYASKRGAPGCPGPKGDKGSRGPKGDTGCKGKRGPIGEKGDRGPQGDSGVQGAIGSKGDTGAVGPTGPSGPQGASGVQGLTGASGPTGPQGASGVPGVKGDVGPQGAQGVPGPQGDTGASGILDFADFYALMPDDNPKPIPVGGAVEFPRDDYISSETGNIVKMSSTEFQVKFRGKYQVQFQVSVSEPGQLLVAINGKEDVRTVAGRENGSTQIVQNCIIETTVEDSVISILNASSNADLTITPSAGGRLSVSAHLVITLLQVSQKK